MTRISLCTLLTLGCCAAAVAAVETSPLVITGSRFAAPLDNQPFSVERVDGVPADTGQPGIGLEEMLRGVPGVSVRQRHNLAQEPQFSIRGFGARSAFGVRGIKLFSDGIPATVPDGQGQVTSVDLDSLERIEVLRGPFASLYGSNSGGVVHLFSRDGEGDPRVSAGGQWGRWGTRRYRLGAEGGTEWGGFVVNQSTLDLDGYRHHSSARLDKRFAKLTFTPGDSRLALIYSDLDQDDTQDPQGLTWDAYRENPRGNSANTLLYNTRKSVDQQQLGLNVQHVIGEVEWQGSLYGGRRRVVQFQSIPVAVQRGSATHAGGVIDFERDFYGLNTRLIRSWFRDAGELVLTGGLDLDVSVDDRQGYENFVDGQLDGQLGVRGQLRRDERDEVRGLAPYLQVAWRGERLDAQAGLRLDEVRFDVEDRYVMAGNGDDSGRVTYRKTNPSLGIGYRLTPGLNLYAGWSKGFETPTLAELAYSGADGSFGFDLRPSRSEQFEAGMRASTVGGGRAQAALFHIRTDDELVVASAQGGRTVYQNAAQTRRQGLELGLEQPLGEQWRARLAYTWLDARYSEGFSAQGQLIDSGNRLPGISRHALFAALAWQPRTGIEVGFEASARSAVDVHDLNQARTAPGHALFNSYARFEQRQGAWVLRETLRIDNLADRGHVGSVIIGEGNGRFYEPGAGRTWFLGLSVEYVLGNARQE